MKKIQIENRHLDSHSGQHDYQLVAFIKNQPVGKIDYSEFQGEIHVSYIWVDPELRRKKIATTLLKHLQSYFPDKSFNMGMFTGEGSKLWKSIPKTTVVNKEYVKLKKEKSKLEKEYQKLLDELNGILDKSDSKTRTNEEQQYVLGLGDKINAINDRLDEIEEEMYDMEPEQKFIKMKDK